MAWEVRMPMQRLRKPPGEGKLQPQESCHRLLQELGALKDLPVGEGERLRTLSEAPPRAAAAADDAAPVQGTESAPVQGTESAPLAASKSGDDAAPGGSEEPQSARESRMRNISVELRAMLEVLEEAIRQEERAAGSAGGGDHGSDAGELVGQFLAADLPVQLVSALNELEFEVRKDVISIFGAIVRLGTCGGADQLLQEYVRGHPSFFQILVEGYERPEIATHCGIMLRSCARHGRLVEAFLGHTDLVIRLLSFTSHGSFDVSSDAFSTLHDYLLTHKPVSSAFLEANFNEFFKVFNGLLQSEDYVTQRQALKLLSETLLDRTFMRVMLLYIGNDQYLQIHMNLLRAKSKAIQFEAFHVFKIFVANPQKPPRVQQILFKNKEKLVKLLDTLRASRPDDRQFAEDQSTVIGKLQALQLPAPEQKGA